MNAVVSGSAGVAVILDGDQIASLHIGSGETTKERHLEEFALLLGDATDLLFLEDVELPEVADRLALEFEKEKALQLSLVLLDNGFSPHTRQVAGEELETSLRKEPVERFVESVLYAHPLPMAIELSDALAQVPGEARLVIRLLEGLVGNQDYIAAASRAWEALPTRLFGGESERSRFRVAAVRGGIFRDIVRWLTEGGTAAPLPEILGEFKDQRLVAVVSEWISILKSERWDPDHEPSPVHRQLEELRSLQNIEAEENAKRRYKATVSRSRYKEVSRRALLVGIDTYGGSDALYGCAADAKAMAEVLSRQKDGQKNFDCIELLDRMEDGSPITRPRLRAAVNELFNFDGEVLLYFSGHGYLSHAGGMLCTSEAGRDNRGIPIQEVVDLSLRSPARQILLIFDCCHSGRMAKHVLAKRGAGKSSLVSLRENMTVIAASRATEKAIETGSHGLFTGALLDALEGGAADHMGFVTAPSIYVYVSRHLTDWDQPPVYKTSATDVLVVRECEPLIDRLKLRQLPALFPNVDYKYPLDPEYEPEDEHGNVKEPVNIEKVEIQRLFKSYRDAGLLKPSDPKQQIYWVARRSGTVELTPSGRKYWWLLVNNKI